MTQIFSIRHSTIYRYRQPVALGEHRMMLRPRDAGGQRILAAEVTIAPQPVALRSSWDALGNHVAVARFAGRASELRFESVVQVAHVADPGGGEPDEHARFLPFTYGAEEAADLGRCAERHTRDPEHLVPAWARRFLRRGKPTETRAALAAMARAIRHDFAYVSRLEPGVQDPVQTLKLGTGSCRDFALLMMEAARSLGLAARFASGYLHTERGSHVEGGHTHAWVQVYLPGVGWADYDPTTGSVGSRDLILVAVAREPRGAVPLHGTFTGFPSDSLGMSVAVSVKVEEALDLENAAEGSWSAASRAG